MEVQKLKAELNNLRNLRFVGDNDTSYSTDPVANQLCTGRQRKLIKWQSLKLQE